MPETWARDCESDDAPFHGLGHRRGPGDLEVPRFGSPILSVRCKNHVFGEVDEAGLHGSEHPMGGRWLRRLRSTLPRHSYLAPIQWVRFQLTIGQRDASP